MMNDLKKTWKLFDKFAGVYELRGIKNGLPTRTKLISWQHYPEDESLAPMLSFLEMGPSEPSKKQFKKHMRRSMNKRIGLLRKAKIKLDKERDI
jgi:hypothetical protein